MKLRQQNLGERVVLRILQRAQYRQRSYDAGRDAPADMRFRSGGTPRRLPGSSL